MFRIHDKIVSGDDEVFGIVFRLDKSTPYLDIIKMKADSDEMRRFNFANSRPGWVPIDIFPTEKDAKEYIDKHKQEA